MLCLAARQCKPPGSQKKVAWHLFARLETLVNTMFSLLKFHSSNFTIPLAKIDTKKFLFSGCREASFSLFSGKRH
jgi:hypothetical protein